jgi:replicative DNA helicase
MARHRKLPSNEHAEAALVGSIILNAGVIPDILSIARPDDFGESTLREVYEKALDLYDQQRPIDADLLGKMARDLTELLADIPEITKRQIVARKQGKPIRDALAEIYGDFACRKNIERAIDRAINNNWLYVEAKEARGQVEYYVRKTPLEVPF